jgi:chemotaxis protein methyltransferase CheR
VATPSCAEFLVWALPRLGLSWQGFRRVHRQVCRRVGHRVQELRLPDLAVYRHYLEAHPEEWVVLDAFCRIPISRLLRDRDVFECLGREVLPSLAQAARARGAAELRCWSAGCASGEEPYSLSILWRREIATSFPELALRLVATDVDEHLLDRARRARYARSSLREVPSRWIEAAFRHGAGWFEVKPEYQEGIEFIRQDIRESLPDGLFDLILCRNVVFTYFDVDLQIRTAARLLSVLRPRGGLVIGLKENLPEGLEGLEPWVPKLRIYRKSSRA